MVGGKRQSTGRFAPGSLPGENQIKNHFPMGNSGHKYLGEDFPNASSFFSDLPENPSESDHWREVDHAVRMALALEIREAEAFLKELSEQKPTLHEEVIWFLDAQDRLDGFMEIPMAEKLSDYLNEQARVSSFNTPLGEYRILDHLGEGGMGQVYLVEREGCLGRKVALKILRKETEHQDSKARFDNEVRLLAHLNHPHISHVYDFGETLDHRPFFTMEYVQGLPVDQFCKHYHLDLEARLTLFLQICSGMAYAHSRGVIHRDLKPANILVTLRDDQPIAKIIDFGIAKSTSAGTAPTQIHTRMDQILGTPIYMSPEQIATISGTDIDPRSDIYVLGALLFEMITGGPARDPSEIEALSAIEALHYLAETKVIAPSRVLSQTSAHQISEEFGPEASVDVLAKRTRGDLDFIVEKAMAKNRVHRYPSVKALMADVQAFLNGDALTSLAGNPYYRFRKILCQNRLEIAAVLVMVLSIFILILGHLGQPTSLSQNSFDPTSIHKKHFSTINKMAGAQGQPIVFPNIYDGAAKGLGFTNIRESRWPQRQEFPSGVHKYWFLAGNLKKC